MQEEQNLEFINNKVIINEVGKFMKLTDLDKINERYMISFLNIDSKSNFDEIDNVIEEKFGNIIKKSTNGTAVIGKT